ncbi:phosphoglycolate phosphatase [Ferrimonas balearica]|uniref:phosphoglycolate phosphatase n=1 Tax=Ferrimonas balearica TaxID=44012 RepID=UPI001C99DE98|nr:phosphoglycolate phosphatase [Ferrimonas balearica]MBY5923216.1 phosphoglycolate phosphatase [Ferrimonas balearica]MBY5997408.1 phosphoglycolate phosphatase [Ferrimonas balearica]
MPFSAVRAIAFDLDGTLIDSVPALAQAAGAALVDLGRPACSEEAARGWIGNGAEMLMRRALSGNVEPDPTLEPELLDHALERFHFHYGAHLDKGSPLYPGVEQTLAKLKARGYRLALITNKPARYLPELMATCGLADHFELMLGGDSLVRRKPDPMPLEHVLDHFGLGAHQMVMVGDSRNDIEAARAAGCASIGLSYGYNYGQPIAALDPTQTLDHFEHLLALLPAR